MIYITFLLFSLFFISCNSSEQRESFIPHEYEFPIDSLSISKTFTFQKEGINQLAFLDLHNKNGITIHKKYTLEKTIDSTISKNGKLQFIYSNVFNNNNLTKGEIQQDLIVENGNKLGKRIRRIIYNNKEENIIWDDIEEYSKDTVIVWKDNKVECLVTKATSNIVYKINNDKSKEEKLTVHFSLYYGKGLGVIRNTTKFKGESHTFYLTEIKNQEEETFRYALSAAGCFGGTDNICVL